MRLYEDIYEDKSLNFEHGIINLAPKMTPPSKARSWLLRGQSCHT